MTSYNAYNIFSIAQFNPIKSNTDNTPIFIYEFESLPANYRFNFNVALMGIMTNSQYELNLKIYNNSNDLVVNDNIPVDTSKFDFPDSKILTPGIGAMNLVLSSPVFTIYDKPNNTFRAELTFYNADHDKLSQLAYTSFFVKKINNKVKLIHFER